MLKGMFYLFLAVVLMFQLMLNINNISPAWVVFLGLSFVGLIVLTLSNFVDGVGE